MWNVFDSELDFPSKQGTETFIDELVKRKQSGQFSLEKLDGITDVTDINWHQIYSTKIKYTLLKLA